ncbi:high frequency lysogenization protein HflD [Permianibacter aggregans]|uniref:High frequency lysogenization protein HflD homolog n=1 Tax=Permianibacter aggregans TaxID=1510150 RepID=A0A4R6UBW4_9GAMM|nr:high frequency lysogenization protein HflD [Permianibacter aggregans]QGX38243.1 lysogenization regulator HflD [Permianibacter aggregans]TDQ44160.1 high frequency lysogenization protein [Permianibacter aggregans]
MLFLSQEKADKLVIPLAGICQAARTVHEIAHTGKFDWQQVEPLVESVLKIDAPTVDAIYGGVDKLKIGLLTVCDQLSMQTAKRDLQIGRYVASLVQLEHQLQRNQAMSDTLGARLQQTQRLRSHQPDDIDALIASLAGIYSDTLSTLPLRIQVSGEARHLQAKENQNRIRAMLLCGIRSAVLWRQLGGRRRHFLLARKALFQAARMRLQKLD